MSITVAELCQRHQITVPELAARADLDEGRVHAIFLGRWTPSPMERQKISQVLQVQPAEIAWGHKTPIQHIYGRGPG